MNGHNVLIGHANVRVPGKIIRSSSFLINLFHYPVILFVLGVALERGVISVCPFACQNVAIVIEVTSHLAHANRGGESSHLIGNQA